MSAALTARHRLSRLLSRAAVAIAPGPYGLALYGTGIYGVAPEVAAPPLPALGTGPWKSSGTLLLDVGGRPVAICVSATLARRVAATVASAGLHP